MKNYENRNMIHKNFGKGRVVSSYESDIGEDSMFTKENFKEIYEKEIEELSLVESAIDKL